MIIKELNLKNFGRFSEATFRFSDGINVIYGPNEAGKTTMYQAIGALFFGLDKQRGRAARTDTYTTYQPWENKTWYEGSLRFETGGKIFLLERNFYHNEKSVRLVCETDGEELSVEHGDLEILLGDCSGELFFNTAAVGQLKMKPQDIVYSYLKNYIAGVQEEGSHSTDVVKALDILEERKKAILQQKKKQIAEINQQISKTDAGLELIEKELSDGRSQLDSLLRQKPQFEEESQKISGSILKKLLDWLKNLFFGKRLRTEKQKRREERLKLEEKINFLREHLGEKESLQEEYLLEKESLYEKLHEQSKDEETKAIDLAMERLREISVLRKEEVMEQLLENASKALRQITKGKYQKLLLEENEEPAVWDGNRKIRLFQVSAGTVDQIYLSLRIGLQELFFSEDTMPLIFDDAFVYFDDKRLEHLLCYLAELDRQVLLFSCHQREMHLLEKQGIAYEKICPYIPLGGL